MFRSWTAKFGMIINVNWDTGPRWLRWSLSANSITVLSVSRLENFFSFLVPFGKRSPIRIDSLVGRLLFSPEFMARSDIVLLNDSFACCCFCCCSCCLWRGFMIKSSLFLLLWFLCFGSSGTNFAPICGNGVNLLRLDEGRDSIAGFI